MDVGETQKKLSQWAEQDRTHRLYDLYHLLHHKDWLRTAQAHVKRNAGSRTAGCDGVNMRRFEENLEENLKTLGEDLKAGRFEPQPVRRTYIREIKAGGRVKMRPLGIPAIRDRIVQEVLRMVLEPIWEADFSRHSFGFRPDRSTIEAQRMRSPIWAPVSQEVQGHMGGPSRVTSSHSSTQLTTTS